MGDGVPRDPAGQLEGEPLDPKVVVEVHHEPANVLHAFVVIAWAGLAVVAVTQDVLFIRFIYYKA